MTELMAEQYRAQATRYQALAEKADCSGREALYRRLERGYLTLADLAQRRALVASSAFSCTRLPS